MRKLLIISTLVLVCALVAGCGDSPNKTGKLVGIQTSFALDDALDGTINNQDFGGVVTVELDDETKVNAIWDNKLGTNFIGGMELEIAPTEDSDYWEVVRIVSTPPAKAENTQGREEIFVIQGVVLDSEGVPLSGKKLNLYRKTSSAPPPKKMGVGGVEAPWRGPEAPANLYMEFEETTELSSPMPGLPKTPVIHIFNPSAETDQSGQFKLEVESSFLGDAKDCTLTVLLPSPGGGITPTQIPQRGGAPLVFECPSSANSEIDLGELRVE